MIGLDTNVVIRYLLQDDPKHSKLANHIIEKAIENGVSLWISQITLCEMVWVLESCYNITKKELLLVLKQLLQTQEIQIEQDNITRQALRDFESYEGVYFSDCLIGKQNSFNNCSCTYTFDKKAAKKLHSNFKLIS